MWLPSPSSGHRPVSLLSTLAATAVLLGLVSAAPAPPVTDIQTRSLFFPKAVPSRRKCRHENIDFECFKAHIDFPTYECIQKDILACGHVDTNSIFYSFGAQSKDVEAFRDLKKGVIYTDVMSDESWHLLHTTARFQLAYPPRLAVFTARFSQAFASFSTGETFLVLRVPTAATQLARDKDHAY
jgi:hypothetical protein